MKHTKIVDFCEFWSPSGGGVRRYYLEKIKYYKKNKTQIDYTFIIPHHCDEIEKITPNLRIIKIKSISCFGKGDYRILLNLKKVIHVLNKYQPDIVEIGSPYLAPWIFRISCFFAKIKPKFIGFWHADFPVTYAKRYSSKLGEPFSNFCEKLAWYYAKIIYKNMHKIFVSSKLIQKRIIQHGIDNTEFLPLGVDHLLFKSIPTVEKNKLKSLLLSPLTIKTNKNTLNVTELKKRKIILFPHRLSNEKGINIFLKSCKIISKKREKPPVVIFSGIGPRLPDVLKFTKNNNSSFYIGYITDPKIMAQWYQISDLTVALSSWETFGLAILEALSSEVPLIGVNEGATLEHLQNSQAGIIIKKNSTALTKAILEILYVKTSKEFSKKSRDYSSKLTWNCCFKNQIKKYSELL